MPTLILRKDFRQPPFEFDGLGIDFWDKANEKSRWSCHPIGWFETPYQ